MRLEHDFRICKVCVKCGSIHFKTDTFKEVLVEEKNDGMIKRVYNRVECAECGSKKVKDIDLSLGSYDYVKEFFTFSSKQRLEDLKKHSINFFDKKEKDNY